jgi:hypothetical protein
MKPTQLIVGLACLGIAIIIFILADGLRRYYSGGFFLLLSVVFLLTARREASNGGDSDTE